MNIFSSCEEKSLTGLDSRGSGGCILVLLLQQQIITNLVTSNNTNLLSFSLGGQKSKWLSLDSNQGVNRTASLLETLGKNLLPCLFQLLQASCALPLEALFSTSGPLLPHSHFLSWFLCLSLASFSYLHRDHSHNSGWFSDFKIINLITSARCSFVRSDNTSTGSWDWDMGILGRAGRASFCLPNRVDTKATVSKVFVRFKQAGAFYFFPNICLICIFNGRERGIYSLSGWKDRRWGVPELENGIYWVRTIHQAQLSHRQFREHSKFDGQKITFWLLLLLQWQKQQVISET